MISLSLSLDIAAGMQSKVSSLLSRRCFFFGPVFIFSISLSSGQNSRLGNNITFHFTFSYCFFVYGLSYCIYWIIVSFGWFFKPSCVSVNKFQSESLLHFPMAATRKSTFFLSTMASSSTKRFPHAKAIAWLYFVDNTVVASFHINTRTMSDESLWPKQYRRPVNGGWE